MARISLPDPTADAELVESLVELAVTRLTAQSPSTSGRSA